MHHFLTKEKTLSRNRTTGRQQPDNWTSEQMCSSEQMISSEQVYSSGQMSSSERTCSNNGGGGDRCDSSAQCMYTYTAPQKNSVLKGLLPTRASLTVYHTRSRSVTGYTYRNPSNLVYHKMSVYDFSFMIPFILYSLKE